LIGPDAVQDKFRIVDRTQIRAQQRIGVPDLLPYRPVLDPLGRPGQSHLVVILRQIAQFHLVVLLDLGRFTRTAQRSDVDHEAVRLHRRNRANAWTVTVNGGEHRKPVGGNHRKRALPDFRRSEWRLRLHHY
jgi:hypothetical protein